MKSKKQNFVIGVYSLLYDSGKEETLYLDNQQHAALKRRKNYKQIISKKLICKVQISLTVTL